MNLYKKLNNIAGWVVFIFALVVYTMTIESSGSFWDCGEFVPGCFKLQVAHAPGAPFFLMLGRLFTLLAMGDLTKVAFMVNFMSGAATAASVMFAFWSITMLAKRFFIQKEEDYTTANIVSIIGAGLVAAGCATFLDSLWFSAVEGEVYALSQFFMSIIVWAILKWENSDDAYADRWLIFIAYMVGLSIGVHLLSLLALPFIALVYYYKRFEKHTWLGFALSVFAGFAVLGFAMKFVISYTQAFLAGFDMFFVNTLGMPFYSGVVFFLFALVAFLAAAIHFTGKDNGVKPSGALLAGGGVLFVTHLVTANNFFSLPLVLPIAVTIAGAFLRFGKDTEYDSPNFRRNLQLGILCSAFVYIGYLSYAMVPIRALANTPINMNRPTDPFSIKSYVDREQYGDRPLVWGPSYAATQNDIIDYPSKGKRYYKGKDKYVEAGDKIDYEFRPEVCQFFPRLGFWNEEQKKQGYRVWLSPAVNLMSTQRDGYGRVISEDVVQRFDASHRQEAEQMAQQKNIDAPGRYLVRDEASTWENWKFFFKYQLGYMYFRYFMWNFSGRQDDIQGTFANDNGRWISGIPFIDNSGLFFTPDYPQEHLSKSMAENKGRNKYFMIPFILGLIGFMYTLYKDDKRFLVILVLFIVTGIFQIIYQNEPPIEPRERDYALAGSFLTYCFWIAFGVLAIIDFLRSKIANMQMPIAVGVCLICLSAPYLMGSQAWDDHTRHERYTARDLAIDYLESCQPNAILFTQGDNDTYPLWYAQEVENIRPDVRVINLSLLGVDWYIQQLKYRWNKSAPVKISFKDEQVQASTRDVVRFSSSPEFPDGQFHDLKKVMNFIASEDMANKVGGGNRELENYLPTKSFAVHFDSSKIASMNMVDPRDMGKVTPTMNWTIGSGMLMKNDLITLDIVANNIMERPICFAVSVSPDAYVGLDKYFQLEGMIYRVVPIPSPGGANKAPVRTDVAYENMLKKFKFGGIAENPNIYLDENIMRMTMNLRGNYERLAESLVEKGEKDKALAVIEHSMKNLPASRVGYNIFMVSYPEFYYLNGKNKEGKKLADDMWAKAEDELSYYQYVYKLELQKAQNSGDRNYIQQMQQGLFAQQTRAIQEQLYTMQEIKNILKKYETPEVMANYDKAFEKAQKSFTSGSVAN